MPKYKVSYTGFYVIEADTLREALESDRDDVEVEYEEYENSYALKLEED